MKEVCRLAVMDEEISHMQDGYDTLIGEGGVNPSGSTGDPAFVPLFKAASGIHADSIHAAAFSFLGCCQLSAFRVPFHR